MAIRFYRMLLLFAVALLPSSLRAADPPKSTETALSKAPADAEYYRSTLRFGETVGLVAKSQAWKLIWEEPAVQELRKKALEGMAGKDFAPVRQFLADPANAEIPALALDAFSHETFFYSGDGTGDFLAMLQELMGVARFGPAFQQLQGRGGDQSRASVRMVLQMFSEKPERLRIPDLIAGFKLSEPEKVAGQLQRIEPVIKENLKETPLKDSVKKVKIGDDEFLVLTLDGSLVPWDDVPIDKYEDKDGEFAPLIKHLKGMKIYISIGVRQGYLLFAIGHSTDAILKFGGKGPKLADRPELKPLAKAAEKPVLAQGYTSAKLRQAVATTAEDIQATADLVKGLIPLAALPDDVVKGLEKDIDSAAQGTIKGWSNRRPPSLTASALPAAGSPSTTT